MPTPGLPARCYGATSGGTHYALGSPSGGVVTSTLSGAGTSLDDQTLRTASNAGDSVHMSFACSPVTISPGGATADGSGGWDILVGQHCAPALAGFPTQDGTPSTSGWSATYNWSVSGTTFQSWTGTTSASSYVGGPGALNVEFPSWHWNDPQNTTETITCTATVTPPAGQGAAFSVTATQNVGVIVPVLTAMGTGGYMYVNGLCPGLNGNVSLWGKMSYSGYVTLPATPAFGTGNLVLVQIISPSDDYYAYDGAEILREYTDPNNGETGLDGSYPYSLYGGGTMSSPSYTYDYPALATNRPLTGKDCFSLSIGHSFQDYLLYVPAGSNSMPVPLGKLSWGASGYASQPSGGWYNYGSATAGTINYGYTSGFTPSNVYPSWTYSVVPVAY